MDRDEKLFYFRRFFCGRKDVYAIRVNGKGYRPRRFPQYELTDKMLIHHMRGDVMLGAYPIFPDGGCDWVAADFDGHNGNAFEEAWKLVELMREYGVEPLCNTSQSGNGVHVRIIFADPSQKDSQVKLQSFQARNFMNAFIKRCNFLRINQGGAFDRIFPTQDDLSNNDKSIGNQIAMPLHMKAAKERGGTLLLDRQFNTIPLGEATWDEIELYEPLDRFDFLDIAEEIGKIDEICLQPEKDRNQSRRNCRIGSGDMFDMVEKCDFFEHAYSDYLSYDEWVALAANLGAYDAQGGRSMFHRLSSLDSRYNPTDTDKKYTNVTSSLNPTTCSRIADSWRCFHLGSDGQCDKFRNFFGKGPRSPAAVPFFCDEYRAENAEL